MIQHARYVPLSMLMLFATLLPIGRSMSAEMAVAQPTPLKKIVVVFKTHFDIGYSHMPEEVVNFYRTEMIDNALKVCEANRDLPSDRQFVWTVPGWPMAQILWEGQDAQRRDRVAAAFRAGRFVVHALPFTTHTETLEPEDLVRGMGFSSRLSREFGLKLPRDAKMTDVPCHSWIVPTLLKHAGIDFIQIGCNDWSSTARTPLLFWWEGPDGSRVLTMLCPTYGSSLFPPSDWPYPVWLAVLHTYDNVGPPPPEYVKQVLDQVREQRPGGEVQIGRMSDFADLLAAEQADVPVVRGDMPDTWIHGPMSDPIGAKTARNTRLLIAAAEALNSLLGAWGLPAKDINPTVAKAYEQSLLYGEHTWGGATQTPDWGGGIRYGRQWEELRRQGNYDRLESSWEAHTDYIRETKKLIRPILSEALQTLADSVGVTGRRVVVFNPLPWRRDGVVELEQPDDAPEGLQDVESKAVESVEAVGGRVRFLARDVPPLGYRVYVPAKRQTSAPRATFDAQTATMENEYLRLRIDPTRGAIVSLIDKHTGRELVDHSAPQALGQYLYERFDADQAERYVVEYALAKLGDKGALAGPRVCFGKPNLPPASEQPYSAASPHNFTLRFEQTPLAVAAVLEAPAGNGIPQPITLRVVLYDDLPYLDLEVTIHDKPLDPWPEAAWLCLPLKVDQPVFKLGRLGAITDLAEDTLPGSNRDVLCLNHGLALVDPHGAGIGICAMDTQLVSFQRPGLYRYSPDFLPEKSWAYVNLFNNTWSTNFRDWLGGTWTSRIRLWAFKQYEAEPALTTPAFESRCPLLAAASDGPAGKLSPVQAGIELSRKGVLITAFGANPDGPGLLLRLWEQAGQAGDCLVQMPKGLNCAQVQPVDLRGRPIAEPIAVSDGAFHTRFQAFAPASFLLVQAVEKQPREFRAMWNHSGTGAFPGNWEKSIKLLAENGFNAVLPNMCSAGLAHYASELLPHSEIFHKYGDQIEQCCAAAKRHSIEVHIWKVNYYLLGSPKSYIEQLRRQGRTQMSFKGEPSDWLCPSDPENRKLELGSMLEVVRKYPVDGLHFDYIRYPDASHCYCGGCRRRFEEQSGQTVANWPEDCYQGDRKDEYHNWRCQQISSLVEAVSVLARKIRPGLKISAAVFGAYPDCRKSRGQNWPAWVKSDWLDFVCPMNYTEDDERFAALVRDQMKLIAGHLPLFPGIGASASRSKLSAEQVVSQIEKANVLGASGFVIFNLDAATAETIVPGVGQARNTLGQ